jgi:hypothetical protein
MASTSDQFILWVMRTLHSSHSLFQAVQVSPAVRSVPSEVRDWYLVDSSIRLAVSTEIGHSHNSWFGHGWSASSLLPRVKVPFILTTAPALSAFVYEVKLHMSPLLRAGLQAAEQNVRPYAVTSDFGLGILQASRSLFPFRPPSFLLYLFSEVRPVVSGTELISASNPAASFGTVEFASESPRTVWPHSASK